MSTIKAPKLKVPNLQTELNKLFKQLGTKKKALQSLYSKELRNYKRMRERATKKGFELPVMPATPKRITEASIRNIQKMKSELGEKAFKINEAGERITYKQQLNRERIQRAERKKKKEKWNQIKGKTIDYVSVKDEENIPSAVKKGIERIQNNINKMYGYSDYYDLIVSTYDGDFYAWVQYTSLETIQKTLASIDWSRIDIEAYYGEGKSLSIFFSAFRFEMDKVLSNIDVKTPYEQGAVEEYKVEKMEGW